MVIHGANTAGFPVDDALVRRIEELARLRRQSPEDVLRDAIDQLARNQDARQAEGPRDTPYEFARKAGLIGCLKGTPPDLSTNPAYLEDLGRE